MAGAGKNFAWRQIFQIFDDGMREDNTPYGVIYVLTANGCLEHLNKNQ